MHRLSRRWGKIGAYYRLLEPVRFSVIVVVALAVAFIGVDQGVDILCGLSGSSHRHDFDWSRVLWFFLGLTYLSLANWYWPRFLLNCDFQNRPGAGGPHLKYEDCLRLHVPRILGVLPCGFMAWGFVNAGTKPVNFILAAVCLLLGVILYFAFMLRRKLLDKSLPEATREKNQAGGGERYDSLKRVAADKLAVTALAIYGIPSMLFGIFFTATPVPLGLTMGSACVLFAAFASWACYGALVVYFGHRYRLPVLTFLLVVAWLASFNNDNHAVREIAGARAGIQNRDTIAASLDSWHDKMTGAYSNEITHPLFIVAAEGGGIRAGYWTALILANLQDQARSNNLGGFSDHLFAISGVSGGSVGGATFVALLTEPQATNCAAAVKMMLNQEFLAPLVGKMLFPDLLQRLIPWPVPAFDRASALEKGWEHSHGWHGSLNDGFTNSFTGLYQDARAKGRFLPALFLNGTEVESGRRIITSSLIFNDATSTNCIDAIDGLEKMSGADIRFSTAAHNSARFTYFSPAGRYPDGTHVVDGGYFENSGAETAHDILNAVATEIAAKKWNDVHPVIITIKNDPVDLNPDPSTNSNPHHVSHEIFTPVTALLNTRNARSDLSFARLRADTLVTNADYIPFGLVDRGTVLPLGWTLSNEAIAEMNSQLANSLAVSSNSLSARRVLVWLKDKK